MNECYIFGHRNPDTDSVCSAIGLSYLKNKLGYKTRPCVLSSLNLETQYVLNYFNTSEPMFLNDVRMKVSDLDYYHNFYILDNSSIYDAFIKMRNIEVSKIPVIDKNKKLLGMISMTSISKRLMSENNMVIDTMYKDIVSVLVGKGIVKVDNHIIGKVRLFNPNTSYSMNDIVIINNSDDLKKIENKKIKMIIIPNNYSCDISMLEKNKINVIISSLDTIEIINRIVFSNSIKSLVNNYKVEPILEDMSFNEFVKINNRCNYSYYPVINRKGESLGLIKYANIDYNKKKNVILVDHNSYEQSAIGIEEANILEIIDHHNISNIITNSPISFRNMPLGSTCTIVYTMFKENGISIPKNIAGLLLSGILSDTLVLNSPTTTKVDKDAVNHLAKLCKVDYKKYGFDMINYGSNLANKSKEEILYNDFKKYSTKDGKIGLGQIFSTDISNIKKELSDYIDMLNKVKDNNDYVFVCLFITDIIKNGTYVIYSDGAKEILDIAFSDNISECYFFPQILSRKLQVLPSILNVMNS